MTVLTIATVISVLLLLAWFTIFITGLSIGDAVLAERSFDKATFVWWLLFFGCVILLMINPAIGRYVCAVFLLLWIIIQSLNFFPSPKRAASYNNLFKHTHHIIPPSDKIAIPDTAHLILLTLLLVSFVLVVIGIFA